MARVHSVGDVINGFEIVEDRLGAGGFTMFYHAKKGGRDIFLKQYTSPACSVPWYKAYLEYEKLIKKCIESNPIKYNTYEIVDIFEYNNTIYQAFEYVPNGKDLLKFLDESGDDTVDNCRFWEKRVLFAKLLMDCIKKLHAAKIVHCDLKPENAVLIQDDSIKLGYRFRVADLDWSFIDGKTPPWIASKAMGYVGTPGYLSPEHLKGQTPTFASDVFTCGIILYEILCNDSPFPADPDEYRDRVLSYAPHEPVLLSNYSDSSNDDICKLLKDCLNPDPSKRPTAEFAHLTLLGRRTATRPPLKPPVAPPIQLVGSIDSTTANIRTEIGKTVLGKLCGSDSQFAATKQYVLFREGASWFVEPCSGTANETMLNGKMIVEKTPIKPGDQIGVGREAKGIVKAVVTIK